MQIEILKDVVSIVAGEKAKGIVELLYSKKNVNEFLISKKLKLTINQTRNILYKLGDEGLVSFIRKKDNKKGGWYTYFWTLNHDKGMIKYRDKLIKELEMYKQKISSKMTERFYHSPNCGMEFSEEVALTNDYTCPECGEILQLKDNQKEIGALEKEIKKNEMMLEKVGVEIADITEKQDKAKFRKIKADDKKKKAERDANRKKRAKEKIKSAGKPEKNTGLMKKEKASGPRKK